MNSNYNEETVRAFKSYIMQIIQHSAVDYIRKVKSSKYTEIAFTDAVDISVSLSNFDEGTLFDFDNLNDFFSIYYQINQSPYNKEKIKCYQWNDHFFLVLR